MASFSWVRSWHGAPTDNKYLVIAAKAKVKPGIVSAVMWALLDYASQHEVRGTVEGFDTETYAMFSGFDEADIIATIDAMKLKNIISDGRLSNWEKRQPKSEENIERVREWRAKKQDVTEGYALLQNDTEGYTDKIRVDTDTDTEEIREDADSPENEIPNTSYKPLEVAFCKATGQYPKTGGGQPTHRWVEAFLKMQKMGATPDDITLAITEMVEKNYTIANPSSIVTWVSNAITKRTVKSNGSSSDEARKKAYIADLDKYGIDH